MECTPNLIVTLHREGLLVEENMEFLLGPLEADTLWIDGRISFLLL